MNSAFVEATLDVSAALKGKTVKDATSAFANVPRRFSIYPMQ